MIITTDYLLYVFIKFIFPLALNKTISVLHTKNV
ncbi:MAG: hypothetical protein BWX51_01432 [Bacteroidetes bacterium ADurb.Bin012]|jgi:hypothetical protein|nr:MAG: hypothetical protein BWX51_01432 [Bacteroidetes bacterium ADurb.Bin012]